MMLKIIKKLLRDEGDERQVQNILNVLQTYVNLSGSVGQVRARDHFLKFLTSQCVSESASEQLTEKHLQASKKLFNIAHCLGAIMDVNSWFIVLQTMHRFDGQLSRAQQQAQTLETTQQHHDLQMLQMWSQELVIQ